MIEYQNKEAMRAALERSMIRCPSSEAIREALQRCQAIEAEAKEKIRAEHEGVLKLIGEALGACAKGSEDTFNVHSIDYKKVFSLSEIRVEHLRKKKVVSEYPFCFKDWGIDTLLRLARWLNKNFASGANNQDALVN